MAVVDVLPWVPETATVGRARQMAARIPARLLGNGSNFAVGGIGEDVIVSGAGDSVLIGDNGTIIWTTASGASHLSSVATSVPTVGGDDNLSAGSGANLLLGGLGDDRLSTVSSEFSSVMIGDHGKALYNVQGLLESVTSTDDDLGGNDLIVSGDGSDVILGGFGADDISGNGGRDFIAGDNGFARFIPNDNRFLIVDSFSTSSYLIGGGDTIRGGDGDDVIFGGNGWDSILGGQGNDVVAGDQAVYERDGTNPGGVTLIQELNDSVGGSDFINGGSGDDILYGESGDDILEGGSGNDSIFGGTGHDRLLGGDGNDTLLGGPGTDYLDGGIGRDTLYVDIFDVWAGYLPVDVIVGGQAQSTGFFLVSDSHTLDLLGLSLRDGAGNRFDEALAAISADGGIAVLSDGPVEMVFAYESTSLILSSSTGAFAMFKFGWIEIGGSHFQRVIVIVLDLIEAVTDSLLEIQWGRLLLFVRG